MRGKIQSIYDSCTYRCLSCDEEKWKLLIAASPIGLIAASKAIVNGIDFWSPFNYTAKQLAITASGGYVGPEIYSKKPGYYYHYHLLGRVGGHSFYGTPSGGQY